MTRDHVDLRGQLSAVSHPEAEARIIASDAAMVRRHDVGRLASAAVLISGSQFLNPRSLLSPISGTGPILLPPILFLLGMVKLVLVSNHEIVAAFRPHDDYWHIRAAAQWVWGRPYNEWALMHSPLYALYIALSGSTGIPLRMSIEIIYIAGAAVLACSLGRLGLLRPLQIVVFALIVFHPYSFECLDFSLAETLYACLIPFFVGFFIRGLTATDQRDLPWNAFLFACATALLWHCRKESILIAGLIGLIAVGILAALLRKAIALREAVRLGIALVAAPLVVAMLLGGVISMANGLTYGLWETNELVAPNYVRAYASLQAIRPDRPIRFVPVTQDARQKAYAVSPSFRQLKPILDGEQEHWTAIETKRALGIDGEIAAGWFYWALIDAAARAGHFQTAADAESFYGRIADEIDAAREDRRVPTRRVPLSYIDPDFSVWLPHLPSSFTALAVSISSLKPPQYPPRPTRVPADVVATFDRVANRRASGSRSASLIAQGWALSPNWRPLEIKIVNLHGETTQSNFEAQSRADVKPLPHESGKAGPPALGYKVDWLADDKGLGFVRFKVLMEGNRSALTDPISNLPIGKVIRLSPAEGDSPVFFALDHWEKAVDRQEEPMISKRTHIVKLLIDKYPSVFGAFVAISLAYVLYLALFRKLVSRRASMVLLFVLAIVSSRLLFFAILDATAWSAQQTRYLFPVALLLPIIPAVFFTLGRRRHGSMVDAPEDVRCPDELRQ